MFAKYSFDVVRGEDRQIPMVFCYRDEVTGRKATAELTGLDFLLSVRDEASGKEIARLSTADRTILLGNLEDRQFTEASEGEVVKALMLCFSHDMTEGFPCGRARFDLFAVSPSEAGDVRQCVMVGDLRIFEGGCYG